jgi:hypothetical protein
MVTADWNGARDARDRAVARVDAAAHAEYKDRFLDSVELVGRRQAEFIGDDVHHAMRRNHPDAATHEYRVVGPLMQRAVREGLCVQTGRYCQGRRRAAHLTAMPIYRSLIYAS